MKTVGKVLRMWATALLLSPSSAFAGIQDALLQFSSTGPDLYSDGSVVADGECYALVWSPAGTVFSGFNADGSPVSPRDRVVLAAPLAQGGRCRKAIFQIPADEYEALKGGEWAVCLVDTRTVAGVPAGARDGRPLRVNRWGAVNGGVKIEPKGASNLRLASSSRNLRLAASSEDGSPEGGGVTSVQPARAKTLSAVPPSVRPPQITAIDVGQGEVWLAVADTVPYLSYTIVSGEKPDNLKTDYFAEVVDGDANAEILIGTPESPKRRFFKVKRAE